MDMVRRGEEPDDFALEVHVWSRLRIGWVGYGGMGGSLNRRDVAVDSSLHRNPRMMMLL